MRTCASCGRVMEERASWARRGVVPKYCSAGCRKHKPNRTDRALETAILELLDGRAAQASICPSEAARRVASDDWRPLMERSRRAARRLVASGHVVITQQGRVVDPSTAKGPIRIRKEEA